MTTISRSTTENHRNSTCFPIVNKVQDGKESKAAQGRRGGRTENSTPIYSAIAAKLAQIGMRLAAEGKLKQTSP
jgi:hypothetical protein